MSPDISGMEKSLSLLMIGGGQMGQAMIAAWQRLTLAFDITVIDPHPSVSLKNLDVTCVTGFDALPAQATFDLVLLAVKPQILGDVLPSVASYMADKACVVSIAAGKTLSFIETGLGKKDVPVIRLMPNTPAMIGQGMTAAVANAMATAAHRQLVDSLCAAFGDIVWLEDEALMHAVTAVSGSGPAYVFALIEALQAAAIEAGLPEELSMQLARKTVEGAAALAASKPDITPAALRHQVTSPGGTTEAGLQALLAEKDGLQVLMTKVIQAASQRSRDLSS